MKPPPFAYACAETQDEALELLADTSVSSVVLAGGQSLLPMMNFRLGAPDVVVDVNRLPGLGSIVAHDGVLRIGALARHSEVIASELVARACPVAAAAARHIGHAPIRNRGTVGGSVAHADPASELPCVAALLDGRVELASTRGNRTVAFEDFVLGPLTTARRPEELLTAVELDAVPDAAYGFAEVSQRTGDFALAGAAVLVSSAVDGTIGAARVGLFGVEAVPRRVAVAEQTLVGRSPTGDLSEVLAAVEAGVEPLDDGRVPTGYRRRLAAAAVERALADALQRLAEGTTG